MSSQDQVINLINDSVKSLREDLTYRLERIESKIDNVVIQEDCEKKRKNCINQLAVKKSEISIRKVTAIGGVITAVIASSAAAVVTILKIFYPEL